MPKPSTSPFRALAIALALILMSAPLPLLDWRLKPQETAQSLSDKLVSLTGSDAKTWMAKHPEKFKDHEAQLERLRRQVVPDEVAV